MQVSVRPRDNNIGKLLAYSPKSTTDPGHHPALAVIF